MVAAQFEERLLSIITAVDPARSQFLVHAWNSVRTQVLPEGWQWEWLIQSDGHQEGFLTRIQEITTGDDRVKVEADRSPSGASATRNTALARASGEFLLNLDADDECEPGAFLVLVGALSQNASLGWVAGRTVYLYPNGTVSSYPDRFPPGDVWPGAFADDWLRHDRPAFHPSAMVVRSSIWCAFGGWMAIRGSEDTGTVAAISEYFPGRVEDEVVLRYRKWPDQTTADESWRSDKPTHYRSIAQRIAAIRALRRG